MHLGVYLDGPYVLLDSEEGTRIAPDPADFPFLLFVCEVGRHFESLLLFARAESGETDDRQLLPPDVRVVPLPPYGNLQNIFPLLSATRPALKAFWHGLSEVDGVWIFGPHPHGLLLAALARIRGKRVVLGVRQDTVAYFRARLRSNRRPLLAIVQVLDLIHRLLARRLSATVVGAHNVQRYRGPRPCLLDMTVSLVRSEDIVAIPVAKSWDGQIELLTVGRVDLEKNPLLLIEALSHLQRRHPGRYRLTWVGTGPLEEIVEKRAAELEIGHLVALRGFVPFGPELLRIYRSAHAFVHVSVTEGMPQVLVEALAAGLPAVATDVGGVRAALDDGRSGLLVPPRDLPALVEAILRLSDDRDLRAELVTRGLDLVRHLTLEQQSERVARFLMLES
jgi:glycosyltransferase involved in cell wall biosynthesis